MALDTCDSRGSIALFDGEKVLGEIPHPEGEDYSSWLLPAVDQLLSSNSLTHSDLAGYAVASGPGSFTGVRVGLTTAKAWAEVYGKPLFPVSRLSVLAARAASIAEYAAAFIDAQRKQIFAGLYGREKGLWSLVGDESVIDPSEFFQRALAASGGLSIAWVTLDPLLLTQNPFWHAHKGNAASIVTVNPPLAADVGRYAFSHLQQKGVDALTLDANYVRRSDAEIFGKKAAGT